MGYTLSAGTGLLAQPGKINSRTGFALRNLPLHARCGVLELEKSGMFFSKDLAKIVLYSMMPLALRNICYARADVPSLTKPRVGGSGKAWWFQTCRTPHFTFLVLKEGSSRRIEEPDAMPIF